jgi:hypothetical protein
VRLPPIPIVGPSRRFQGLTISVAIGAELTSLDGLEVAARSRLTHLCHRQPNLL